MFRFGILKSIQVDEVFQHPIDMTILSGHWMPLASIQIYTLFLSLLLSFDEHSNFCADLDINGLTTSIQIYAPALHSKIPSMSIQIYAPISTLKMLSACLWIYAPALLTFFQHLEFELKFLFYDLNLGLRIWSFVNLVILCIHRFMGVR